MAFQLKRLILVWGLSCPLLSSVHRQHLTVQCFEHQLTKVRTFGQTSSKNLRKFEDSEKNLGPMTKSERGRSKVKSGSGEESWTASSLPEKPESISGFFCSGPAAGANLAGLSSSSSRSVALRWIWNVERIVVVVVVVVVFKFAFVLQRSL